MTALAANVAPQKTVRAPSQGIAYKITSTSVAYLQGIQALNLQTGRVGPYTGAESVPVRIVGINAGQKRTGNAGGTEDAEFRAMRGSIEGCTVATVDDADTDIDKLVYAQDDNPDALTTARPLSNASVFGRIEERTGSSSYTIERPSPEVAALMDYMGAGRQIQELGRVDLADCTSNAACISGYKLRGVGKIAEWGYRVVNKKSAANGEGVSVDLYIGGTAVTGATLAISGATPTTVTTVYDTIASGAGRFRDGQALKVVTKVAGVPHTSGSVCFFIERELSN